MKKLVFLLLFPILGFTACNNSSEPKPLSKDSTHKKATDSFDYNPATPPAQNSDDPSRFSK